jgi:hypothetical protein
MTSKKRLTLYFIEEITEPNQKTVTKTPTTTTPTVASTPAIDKKSHCPKEEFRFIIYTPKKNR